MRIIVVSDSHASPEMLLAAVRHAGHTDMLLHAGDGQRDCAVLDGNYDGQVYMVRGNCDIAPAYDFIDRLIQLDGVSIYLTHGHQLSVKTTLNRIWLKGREAGADIICFGHTHIPLLDKQGAVTLLNPGSVRNKTYGLIEIKEGKSGVSLHRFD